MMARIITVAITVAVIVGVALLIFGTKPDCPSGTVGVFYQYSGWACVSGARP